MRHKNSEYQQIIVHPPIYLLTSRSHPQKVSVTSIVRIIPVQAQLPRLNRLPIGGANIIRANQDGDSLVVEDALYGMISTGFVVNEVHRSSAIVCWSTCVRDYPRCDCSFGVNFPVTVQDELGSSRGVRQVYECTIRHE